MRSEEAQKIRGGLKKIQNTCKKLLDSIEIETPKTAEPTTTVTVWQDESVCLDVLRGNVVLYDRDKGYIKGQYTFSGPPDIDRVISETLGNDALVVKIECDEEFQYHPMVTTKAMAFCPDGVAPFFMGNHTNKIRFIHNWVGDIDTRIESAITKYLKQQEPEAKSKTTVTVWTTKPLNNVQWQNCIKSFNGGKTLLFYCGYSFFGTPDIDRVIRETLGKGAWVVKVECTEPFDLYYRALGKPDSVLIWKEDVDIKYHTIRAWGVYAIITFNDPAKCNDAIVETAITEYLEKQAQVAVKNSCECCDNCANLECYLYKAPCLTCICNSHWEPKNSEHSAGDVFNEDLEFSGEYRIKTKAGEVFLSKRSNKPVRTTADHHSGDCVYILQPRGTHAKQEQDITEGDVVFVNGYNEPYLFQESNEHVPCIENIITGGVANTFNLINIKGNRCYCEPYRLRKATPDEVYEWFTKEVDGAKWLVYEHKNGGVVLMYKEQDYILSIRPTSQVDRLVYNDFIKHHNIPVMSQEIRNAIGGEMRYPEKGGE